jgi:hypothetical protein
VDLRARARVHRHVWRRGAVLRLGQLI